MNWTNEEKLSVTKVLLDIINADGHVDSGEVAYMNQLRLTLGISDSDIKSAHSRSVSESMLSLRGMTNDKKVAVGIMMTEMIEADGDVDPKEVLMFKMIHDLIGMPQLS